MNKTKEHNPISLLMREHEIISLANAIIQNMNKQWETDEKSYIQKVTILLTFFTEYSDKFHHQKEEDIMFKELRNNPEFTLDEMLNELEEHHELFRDMVIKIKEELNENSFKNVQLLLSKYINDLLDHIAVENDELFIAIESLYSERELERLYFNFFDKDIELGQGRKIELEKSLSLLS